MIEMWVIQMFRLLNQQFQFHSSVCEAAVCSAACSDN